jgi:hypothetical protein
MSGTTTIDQTTELSSVYVGGNVVIERDAGTPLLDPVVVAFNTGALNLDILTTFTVQDLATLDLASLINVGAGDQFVIGQDGTIELGTGVSAAVLNDVTFAGGASRGVLVVDPGVDVNLLTNIAGFKTGDTIDFTGTAAPASATSYTDSFNGSDTSFTIALIGGGTTVFSVAGDLTGDQFLLSDNLNGLVFTDIACFAPGTKILIAEGEVPVEQLVPGDIAVLADGKVSPITFIGQRFYDLRRHPRPETVSPIRIAAGALADGIPARPLTLSPDHALFIDGVLVQAKDLVDGIAIVQDMEATSIRYYHVELEAHGILLAEGAPAESFLDTGHRGIFENANAPLILHPDLMQLRREAESIAPLCHDGEILSAIRARLHARKRALGLNVVPATGIVLIADGKVFAPIADTMSEITFAVPPSACDILIKTESFVPATVDPVSNDRRRLGLNLTGVAIDGASLPLDAVLHPASLHPGDHGDLHAWTHAAIRLRIPPGARSLTLKTAGRPKAWALRGIAA